MRNVNRAARAVAMIAAVFVSGAAIGQGAQVVIDPTGLIKQLEEIQLMENQISQYRSMLQGQAQQYQAMTGNRGMGMIYSQGMNATNMPSTANIYNNALSQGAQAYRNQIANSATMTTQQMQQQRAQVASADAGQIDAEYQATVQRMQTIQGLQAQINASTDPKQIQDLNARMHVEELALSDQSNQISLQHARVEAQRDLLKSEEEEQSQQFLSPDNSYVPKIAQ